jgi:C4-dicarboxylate-binding protein DctP
MGMRSQHVQPLRRRAFLRSGAIAAAATVAAPALLRAQDRVVRFSHAAPEDTPKGQGALLFKRRIEERSQGRVTIELFPDSRLHGEASEMEALALGDVQIIAPPLSSFSRYAKRMQVFDLPFLFDSLAALDRFEQGETGRALRGSMERLGFVGLAYWRNGFKQLSANRLLRLPQDAQGLKFRIQDSGALASQFEAIGAVPVVLAAAETRAALAAGTVDGTEDSWLNLHALGIYEVQKAIIETNHGIIDDLVVVSTEFWQALPESLRSLFSTTMEEVRVEVARMADEMNRARREAILQSGRVQLVMPAPDERRAWAEAMRAAWAPLEEEVGKDLVEAALQANQA